MHMNKILYICVLLGHLNESIRTIQLQYIVYFRLELLTGLVFAIVQSTHDEFWYNVSWCYIKYNNVRNNYGVRLWYMFINTWTVALPRSGKIINKNNTNSNSLFTITQQSFCFSEVWIRVSSMMSFNIFPNLILTSSKLTQLIYLLCYNIKI